jgi:DNA-binding NtrC family response regulator
LERDREQADSDPPDGWDTKTMAGEAAELRRLAEARVYLLVFEGESSRMVPLAPEGDVVLGRGEACEVRIVDGSVSRRHAQLTLTFGQGVITDLDSQNGTKVNGERIAGGRPLVSGDLVTLGSVNLSYHSSVRHVAPREVLGLPAFQQRADQECERALRFGRSLALIAVNLGLTGRADRPLVARLLGAKLRTLDAAAWAGGDQLVLLLPELDAAAGTAVAEDLLVAFAGHAPQCRVGLAVAPADGCDADTLIGSARAAALVAEPRQVIAASNARTTRAIGDRTLVMADPVMARLYALIERLAVVDLAVLVCGETGTGKELAASALHAWSPRRHRPLVSLNCAAIAETLVESELFGHEKGAFSGASSGRAGLLETADGGTVFLDEIGELSLPVQAKLLRVLEAKKVTRLGDVREREVDIRVIAATNRNLDDEVAAGRFRRDLFFRLSGATLWLPPLRDRQRELPLLAQMFLDEACRALDRGTAELSPGAIQTLASYGWPGNVRELKNVIEYLAATVFEDVIHSDHVAERLRATGALGGNAVVPRRTMDLTPHAHAALADETRQIALPPEDRRFRPLEEEVRELERTRIGEALEAARGNQTRAAELISMPLRTFMTKVKLYNLSPRKR